VEHLSSVFMVRLIGHVMAMTAVTSSSTLDDIDDDKSPLRSGSPSLGCKYFNIDIEKPRNNY